MRLHEITNFKVEPEKRYSGKFKVPKERGPIKGERGMFSRVKPDPKDPSKIQKYNYIPVGNLRTYDPFWLYVDYVTSNDLHNINPYFPKFYRSQVITDIKGLKVRKLSMELLQPFSSVTQEEISEYVQKILTTRKYKEIPDGLLSDKKELIEWILGLIEGWVYHGPNAMPGDMVRDEQLLQAIYELNIMMESFNKYYSPGTKIDIFDDNVMVRREGGKIQPVFADPFMNRMGINIPGIEWNFDNI